MTASKTYLPAPKRITSSQAIPNPFYTSPNENTVHKWTIISSPDQALLKKSIPRKMMSNSILIGLCNLNNYDTSHSMASAVIAKPHSQQAFTENSKSQRDSHDDALLMMRNDTLIEKHSCCVAF